MLKFHGTVTPSIQLPVAVSCSTKPAVVIGREGKIDLVLTSDRVPRMISRVHARITRTLVAPAAAVTKPVYEYEIVDCKSLNGVFVNDKKVASHKLADGDVITFGGKNGNAIPLGGTLVQPSSEFVYQFKQTDYAHMFAEQMTPLPEPGSVKPLQPIATAAAAANTAPATAPAIATAIASVSQHIAPNGHAKPQPAVAAAAPVVAAVAPKPPPARSPPFNGAAAPAASIGFSLSLTPATAAAAATAAVAAPNGGASRKRKADTELAHGASAVPAAATTPPAAAPAATATAAAAPVVESSKRVRTEPEPVKPVASTRASRAAAAAADRPRTPPAVAATASSAHLDRKHMPTDRGDGPAPSPAAAAAVSPVLVAASVAPAAAKPADADGDDEKDFFDLEAVAKASNNKLKPLVSPATAPTQPVGGLTSPPPASVTATVPVEPLTQQQPQQTTFAPPPPRQQQHTVAPTQPVAMADDEPTQPPAPVAPQKRASNPLPPAASAAVDTDSMDPAAIAALDTALDVITSAGSNARASAGGVSVARAVSSASEAAAELAREREDDALREAELKAQAARQATEARERELLREKEEKELLFRKAEREKSKIDDAIAERAAKAKAAAAAPVAASPPVDDSPVLKVGKTARRRAGLISATGSSTAAAAAGGGGGGRRTGAAAASSSSSSRSASSSVSSGAATAVIVDDIDAAADDFDALDVINETKSKAAASGPTEECPVCTKRVSKSTLETHVMACIAESDARMARDAKLAASLAAGGGAAAAAAASPPMRPVAARSPVPIFAAPSPKKPAPAAAAAAARDDSKPAAAAAAASSAPKKGGAESAAEALARLTKPVKPLFGSRPSMAVSGAPAASSSSAAAAAAAAAPPSPKKPLRVDSIPVDDDDDVVDVKRAVAAAAGGGGARAVGSGAAAAAAAASAAVRKPSVVIDDDDGDVKSSSAAAASSSSAAAARSDGKTGECPICYLQIAVSELPRHAAGCTGPMATCPICDKKMEPTKLKTHVNSCLSSGSAGSACSICHARYPNDEMAAHRKRCIEKQAELSLDERIAFGEQRKEQGVGLINPMQLEAVTHVANYSTERSDAARKELVTRFAGLGLSKESLDKTLRWIRNEAPLIVHFNCDRVMNFFVNDTNYRNQFETHSSGGTLCSRTRIGWEDRMFDRIYHSAAPAERCKYGVLNIVNDPAGVKACSPYGDSFLVLKNETCRLRTTFASEDTSSEAVKLASCENYAHVLAEFSNEELIDVVKVATREEIAVDSGRIGKYKELQLHGELQFARDVELVCIHSRHKSDKAMVALCEQFATKNGINLVWIE